MRVEGFLKPSFAVAAIIVKGRVSSFDCKRSNKRTRKVRTSRAMFSTLRFHSTRFLSVVRPAWFVSRTM